MMGLDTGYIQQIIDNSTAQLRDSNVTRNLEALASSQTEGVPKDIKQAATEFEAVFISHMLQFMFSGVESDEIFGGGYAEEVYRSMLVDEYGQVMSRTGGIGISEVVQRQLMELQTQKGG